MVALYLPLLQTATIACRLPQVLSFLKVLKNTSLLLAGKTGVLCHHWRIMPSGVVSVPDSYLNVMHPQPLSHGEHRAILGQGGLVSDLCPVWQRKEEHGHNRAIRNRPFQLVESYKCLCVNCPYEVRVVRIRGGLVLLEKQLFVNGILSPVVHDQRAHDNIPSSSPRGNIGRLDSLSYAERVHCEAWTVE